MRMPHVILVHIMEEYDVYACMLHTKSAREPGCDIYTNDRLSDSKQLEAQNPESRVRDGVIDNSGLDNDILKILGIESP